ncbi:alpha/beta hydrolase [Lactobacillus selangorensis]|nr:alpha/beta hydrolase [Lactobacillus selangorensis]
MTNKKLAVGTFGAGFLSGYLLHHLLHPPVAPLPFRKLPAEYHYSQVPTLFFHGSGGGRRSLRPMLTTMQDDGAAEHTLTIAVDPFGGLHFKGKWPAEAVNPTIQVLFQLTFPFSLHQEAHWIAAILRALQQRYDVTTYNAVGHSLGAEALLYVLLDPNEHRMPHAQKTVFIAGPFDDALHSEDQLTADGMPLKQDAHFKWFDAHKANFSKQTDVLNIYGNVQQLHSDKTVPNGSSQALAYLVAGQAHTYQEREFTMNALHTQLLSNPAVIQTISDYLWK